MSVLPCAKLKLYESHVWPLFWDGGHPLSSAFTNHGTVILQNFGKERPQIVLWSLNFCVRGQWQDFPLYTPSTSEILVSYEFRCSCWLLNLQKFKLHRHFFFYHSHGSASLYILQIQTISYALNFCMLGTTEISCTLNFRAASDRWGFSDLLWNCISFSTEGAVYKICLSNCCLFFSGRKQKADQDDDCHSSENFNILRGWQEGASGVIKKKKKLQLTWC